MLQLFMSLLLDAALILPAQGATFDAANVPGRAADRAPIILAMGEKKAADPETVSPPAETTNPDDTAEAPAQPDPATTCAAAEFAHLVGQPASAADAVPDPKRVLRPESKMTMDHRIDRTNIRVDDQDVITSLNCG